MVKTLPLPISQRKGFLAPKLSPPPFFFLSLIAPLPPTHPPFSSYEIFSLYSTLWSILLVSIWDTAQFINCLIKPVRSSNVFGWILFLTAYCGSPGHYWALRCPPGFLGQDQEGTFMPPQSREGQAARLLDLSYTREEVCPEPAGQRWLLGIWRDCCFCLHLTS